MDTFVTEEAIEAALGGRGSAFSSDVLARIYSFRIDAQVEVINRFKTSRNFYSYYGEYHYALYSPSFAAHERAKDLYDKIRAEGSGRSFELVQRAEVFLCLSEAMPTLGLRPTELGGFLTSVGDVENPQLIMGRAGIARFARELQAKAGTLINEALQDYDREPEVTYAI